MTTFPVKAAILTYLIYCMWDVYHDICTDMCTAYVQTWRITSQDFQRILLSRDQHLGIPIIFTHIKNLVSTFLRGFVPTFDVLIHTLDTLPATISPIQRFLYSLTLYSSVVTLYTNSLTFNNSTFCPHNVVMCLVWI
jgi:hypothetical protein